MTKSLLNTKFTIGDKNMNLDFERKLVAHRIAV
jgi:hypothetical protein